GLGAKIQALPRLAIILDVIGSSGIAAEHFQQPFPTEASVTGTLFPIVATGTVPRTDLVDLAVGCRVAVTNAVRIYLDAIIPLTQDGIRADVVPAGGIEWRF